MAIIKITMGEIGEGYQQYQSMIATIEFEKWSKGFILETELIDNEDYKEDLDLIETFYTRWQLRMSGEPIIVERSSDVNELIEELEHEVEVQKELEKLDEARTMKRCAD